MAKERITDFASRVKLIRKAVGMNQKEFAWRLKISAPSVSEIEAGKYKPGHDFYVSMTKEFKVNLYYLLFGEGEMFVDPQAMYSSYLNSAVIADDDMRQFLWYFERSKIVQYLMMGHFKSILHNERAAIEKDIEEFQQRGT